MTIGKRQETGGVLGRQGIFYERENSGWTVFVAMQEPATSQVCHYVTSRKRRLEDEVVADEMASGTIHFAKPCHSINS